MIENDIQYAVTKKKLKEFKKALRKYPANEKVVMDRLMRDSIQSQIEIFVSELELYEVKNNKNAR